MKLNLEIRVSAVLLLPLLATNCSVYRPKSPIPSNYTKQILVDVTAPKLLADYNALPESTAEEKSKKVSRRNQIMIELIYLVDRSYFAFENRFYGSQAVFATGADAVNLGLTGAASVSGAAELKSVLSAIATGTTGFKTSVEKNFYDQQTRGAIVAKMRAARALQLATMQDEHHMKGGVTDYGLENGLSDIQTYYDAGTVVGALQSIAESAGQDKTKADDQQKTNSRKAQSIN